MLETSRATTVGAGGLALASTTWRAGRGGSHVLAVHANGFCKEVYRLVAEDLARLLPHFEMTALDQRGHGDSAAPVPPFDWWDLGRDVLAVAAGTTGTVAVGHSSGGAAVAMAEILAPGTFSRLILVEPVLFPGPRTRFEEAPLARAALKRRRRFASLEAAMANWRGKGPFASWEERVLEAFARGALRDVGGAWELKCAPETEAEFYRSAMMHGAFDRLGEITIPVHIMAGEHSDSHDPAFVELLRSRLPNATAEVIAGLGHLLVMERPALVAERLAAALDPGLALGHR